MGREITQCHAVANLSLESHFSMLFLWLSSWKCPLTAFTPFPSTEPELLLHSPIDFTIPTTVCKFISLTVISTLRMSLLLSDLVPVGRALSVLPSTVCITIAWQSPWPVVSDLTWFVLLVGDYFSHPDTGGRVRQCTSRCLVCTFELFSCKDPVHHGSTDLT